MLCISDHKVLRKPQLLVVSLDTLCAQIESMDVRIRQYLCWMLAVKIGVKKGRCDFASQSLLKLNSVRWEDAKCANVWTCPTTATPHPLETNEVAANQSRPAELPLERCSSLCLAFSPRRSYFVSFLSSLHPCPPNRSPLLPSHDLAAIKMVTQSNGEASSLYRQPRRNPIHWMI